VESSEESTDSVLCISILCFGIQIITSTWNFCFSVCPD